MKIIIEGVYNIIPAISGMRNALKSWDKSDSTLDEIGPKDLALACKLIRGGTEHRKFLRQIFVSLYIDAPMYWWAEFDTYKIGTTRNSTSFMHTGLKEPFRLDQFEHSKDTLTWNLLINNLNQLREKYDKTKDPDIFDELRSILPSGVIYGSSVTISYENVLNIIHQRKNHKLREWHKLCDRLLDLPYIKEFVAAMEGKE